MAALNFVRRSVLGPVRDIAQVVDEDVKKPTNQTNKSHKNLFLLHPPPPFFPPKATYDNFIALRNFFRKFPEYLGRDFYIAGASYSGMFVPLLAEMIMSYPGTKPNLKVSSMDVF